MPDAVRRELEKRRLLDLYGERPFYQRNDYLAWIDRAMKPETRRSRIDQMLNELDQGGVYMGKDHPSSRTDHL